MLSDRCDGCGTEFRAYDNSMFLGSGFGPEYELCLVCAVPILAHLSRLGLLWGRNDLLLSHKPHSYLGSDNGGLEPLGLGRNGI